MHNNCKTKKSGECGSTTLEALFAVIILFLIVFAMLQIYHWCITKQVCQYSAFYTCKSLALGYQQEFALRAARVSAIAISGKSIGAGNDDEIAAEHYMIYGDNSGVNYEYWHQLTQYNNPTLWLLGSITEDDAGANVRLKNAPLISPPLAKIFGIKDPPEPSATVRSHNYAKELLED